MSFNRYFEIFSAEEIDSARHLIHEFQFKKLFELISEKIHLENPNINFEKVQTPEICIWTWDLYINPPPPPTPTSTDWNKTTYRLIPLVFSFEIDPTGDNDNIFGVKLLKLYSFLKQNLLFDCYRTTWELTDYSASFDEPVESNLEFEAYIKSGMFSTFLFRCYYHISYRRIFVSTGQLYTIHFHRIMLFDHLETKRRINGFSVQRIDLFITNRFMTRVFKAMTNVKTLYLYWIDQEESKMCENVFYETDTNKSNEEIVAEASDALYAAVLLDIPSGNDHHLNIVAPRVTNTNPLQISSWWSCDDIPSYPPCQHIFEGQPPIKAKPSIFSLDIYRDQPFALLPHIYPATPCK